MWYINHHCLSTTCQRMTWMFCSNVFLLKLWTERLQDFYNIFKRNKTVTATVTGIDSHYSEIQDVSIHPGSRSYSIPEFPRHTNHKAVHTTDKWLQDCDHSVWVSYSSAPGTVVTAWWESSHVLVPIGFLSSSWLESLLSITDVRENTVII